MTSQMREDYTTQIAVEEIIHELKFLTHKGDCVDGETMQYILEQVGMHDQMLRQLMMSMPYDEVEYIMEERAIFENNK